MSDNNKATIALLETHFDIAFAAPDGIKKLRELILSLAMQGKLVPQDSSDQPASELLKEIEAEKERLIKDGKIKKSKPLPEIKPDEVPYDLPKGWEWVYLGKLTTFTYGKTPESKNPIYWSQTDGENWAAISDLPLRGYLCSTNKKITQQAVDDVFKSETLPVGTLLMSFKLSIGKTAISKIPVYHNEAIISFRELIPELKMYLFWILSSISNAGDHKNAIKGNTLNSTSLNNLQIPLPPLAEQRRIVAKIDELMARCDELEKLRSERNRKQITVQNSALNRLLIAKEESEFNTAWQFITQHFSELYSVKENVTELRKAILQLAVMGKLVPQDINDQPALVLANIIKAKRNLSNKKANKNLTNQSYESFENMPFQIPSSWIWQKIDDLYDVSGGIQKTPRRKPVLNFFPYLRVANVQRGRLNLEQIEYFELIDGELDKWRLQSGDLLIVEGNGSDKEIGRCAVWKGEIENCVHQNHIIRMRPIEHDGQLFTLLFLNSPMGMAEMKDLAITTSGLYSLSVGKIRQILIPLPPLAEQHRIVAKIDQLMALCDNLEKQIDNANSKQTNLLNAVITKI